MVNPISSDAGEAKSATKREGRTFVVGLGTNLGDRLEMLGRAVAGLARVGRVEAVASLWESDAVGPPQDRYWNSAARLVGSASPAAIVRGLIDIEVELGRIRTLRWGPRVIDLDLLWIDGEASDDPACEVPHPRLHERSFALLPMLELVPGAIDPRTQRPFPPVGVPAIERIGAGHMAPPRWVLARE